MRILFALLVAASMVPTLVAQPPLVIHEWGTFTNLQDESGNSVGGINSDDEPLPKFAHDLAWNWNVGDAASQQNNRMKQGYPRCHPDVTIRLETPVLYFHPAPGAPTPAVNVEVQFRGGYLTQYYPSAVTGKIEDHISTDTVSGLQWHDLRLGLDKSGPQTDSHVWTAPRRVDAATVTTLDDETEKFLFYRGVGHIDAPLRLIRSGAAIEIHGQLGPRFASGTQLKIPRLWFCEFHEEGRCVFRELSPLTVSADSRKTLVTTSADFAGEDFTDQHLVELKKNMRAALIAEGLFPDEADALLSTWELSYFKSSGVRLFYIVPREWTEHYLPLKTSADAPVIRVMVGRIDLVTPEHRRLLRQIADNTDVIANDAEAWKLYDHLGRFRNALLLDERARRPGKSLDAFVNAHGLDPVR